MGIISVIETGTSNQQLDRYPIHGKKTLKRSANFLERELVRSGELVFGRRC
jgi:hypothetical protein